MYIKYLHIFIILCIGITTSLVGKEKVVSKKTIHTLIQEIKRAPASEKRIKMNELKILLRSMNQKTRNEAMRNLQKSFAKHGAPKSMQLRTNEIANHSNQNQPMKGMQRTGQGQQQGGRK